MNPFTQGPGLNEYNCGGVSMHELGTGIATPRECGDLSITDSNCFAPYAGTLATIVFRSSDGAAVPRPCGVNEATAVPGTGEHMYYTEPARLQAGHRADERRPPAGRVHVGEEQRLRRAHHGHQRRGAPGHLLGLALAR